MGLGQVLSTLAISFAIVGYMFYGIVRVEEDMDSRNNVMWMYAARKFTRTVSVTGEYLGFGNRVVLSRSVSQLVSFPSPVDTSRVQITFEDFNGVRVRLYRPDRSMNNGPALLWIHGGGWVTRTVESDDKVASELARRLDILVISIDYRLAPEHPFPAAIYDCEIATRHLLENANKYHVNAKRVVIAGASAGGNLATAVALKLRDDKSFPHKLEHQVLIVPCLQALNFQTPSYDAQEYNAFLPKNWMIHYWMLYGFGYEGKASLVTYATTNDHVSSEVKRSSYWKYVSHTQLQQKYIPQSYMPDNYEHGDEEIWNKVKAVILNPLFAPLMADDLSNLPDAYIITADYDVLRDDGLMYGRRLSDAGNNVIVKNYPKAFHAVIDHFNTIDVSKQALDELVSYLSQRL